MSDAGTIIGRARAAGLAIPSFNIPYLPMLAPVVRAIADQDSFGLIAVARLEWVKFESRSLAAVRDEYAKWAQADYVRLHLDHVPVVDEDNLAVDYLGTIKEAIALGYESVMVDGSRLKFRENAGATRQAVALAHAAGVPCEAELGAVLGHEAGPLPPYEDLFRSGAGFTRVDEARRFVEDTGCDWLSVAIGNIHGAISKASKDQKKVEARLNLEHLERLAEATGIPLVLHGGSGVRREDVLGAIKRGIAKVNIGTEIRQAYEVPMRDTGNVKVAQDLVYERTVSLIRDYFGNTGIRKTVAG